MLDGVGVGDERAETGQLDGGGRVQRDRDLARRVGEMMAKAVMERLDRVPDRMGVEEVDQEPVARLLVAVRRGRVIVGAQAQTRAVSRR